MAQAVRSERDFVGWIWMFLFIAFNLAMAAWAAASIYKMDSVLSILLILVLWAPGFVILGTLSYLTRGGKVTISPRPAMSPSSRRPR
jgi:hypothetical protein